MATYEQVTAQIAALKPPQGWSSDMQGAYLQALNDACQAAEIPFRGVLYGANTPEQKFTRFVELTTEDKGWSLTESHISQQTGWTLEYSRERLEQEVEQGRLARKKVVICTNCGVTDDDEYALDDLENGDWRCWHCQNTLGFPSGYDIGEVAINYIGAKFVPQEEQE
jgi:hypothetical protein